MVTDKLGSYGAANREIGLSVCDHRHHKGLNNRGENSHQPIRRRERIMNAFQVSTAFTKVRLHSRPYLQPSLIPKKQIQFIRSP